MSMSFKTYAQYGSRETSQSEPIPGKTMQKNAAGGYVFAIDDFARLRRFLVLGTEGGTYYTKEADITKANVDTAVRCIKQDGPEVVRILTEISDAGRAPKNDPAILVLAMCFGLGDADTKAAAEGALPLVCRTGTHLFHFAEFVQKYRGWGRALKRAVGNWYVNNKGLAYDAIKYRQRDGWTHRDLLRLSHPTARDAEQCGLFDWIAGRDKPDRGIEASHKYPLIDAFEYMQLPPEKRDLKTTIDTILEVGLPREALPTDLLKEPKVWEALLPGMPLTAMIRNLGNMSKLGVIAPMNASESFVASRLANAEYLAKSRVHPIQVLSAMLTYGSGRSVRGSGEWDVSSRIMDALDAAFYASFGNVEPAGKRTFLALDVSGSMSWDNIGGIAGLTPCVASAAMAMITERTEPQTFVAGFETSLTPYDISSRKRLDDVVKYVQDRSFGGTNCSAPMIYALAKGLEVDTFVVYTDNETWAGGIHPSQALVEYREKTGIPAKLAVVGMTATDCSIADPADAGMLDFVGFDSSTPQALSAFSRGDV